ncbi:MAG: adenosylmethionine--8-amino-7-oxononanoate transaminase [Candidatus Berkiella sp.]
MKQNATVWLPYAQMQTTHPPFEVVRTNGSLLHLKDGRQLVDGVASWWTSCHGYNHPHIMQALQKQSEKLAHVMLGGLIHEQASTLATRLSNLLPKDLDYVFYSESGSVAVEVAMKMALQYWLNKDQKQRQQFLYFQNGYHGDTFYTMSVSDPQDGIHPPLEHLLPKQLLQKIPINQHELAIFEQWLQQHHQCIAGMIIEPLIQGAGGMKITTSSDFSALIKLCQKYQILVIVDEIFTGFGRTGSLFATLQTDIVPDIMCLSKALTAGVLPLAATIAHKKIYDTFLGKDFSKALMHGTTFMGNALACACANASLDLFEQEPRLAQVADIEGILKSELMPLQDVNGVKDVRVKGAIGVVQLKHHLDHDLNWFKHKFIDEGVWCRPFGDIVYTTPALNIDKEALLKITDSMTKLIKLWSVERFNK